MNMRKPYRPLRISLIYLAAALGVAVLALIITSLSYSSERLPYADIQLSASRRMQQAEEWLLTFIQEEGIEIEPEDINKTGLIGPEWTELTSSLGMLEAKRTSLNPNFAALIVKYFELAGLKAGDRVAFGLSGSFPGLGIAAISAANEMKLEPLVIASYASSMYGGTRPQLTTIRMLKKLEEADILSFQMLAVSPGSDGDKGESILFPNGRRMILELAKEDGYFLIDAQSLEESITQRQVLYGDNIKCFVNIGGASANIGTSGHFPEFKSGLVKDPPRIPTTANRGLIYEYAARGLPVINLLNVRELAGKNGLPFDPVPLPQPGEGGVYFENVASPIPALLALAAILALLYIGFRKKKRKSEE